MRAEQFPAQSVLFTATDDIAKISGIKVSSTSLSPTDQADKAEGFYDVLTGCFTGEQSVSLSISNIQSED